jgi:membrane-associated phospholipid phosphatase
MRATATAIALLVLLLPIQVSAQAADAPPADKQPVAKPAADTGRYALITKRDVMFAGGFVLATFAVSQLDKSVQGKLQDTLRIISQFTSKTENAFNLLGVPGAFVISGGLYVAGRVARAPGLADAGLHTIEAVVIAEGLTYLSKWGFGRERPYSSGIDDPGDFSFGRGLKGEAFSSFPSGHASAAFAAASALTAEISSRRPKTARWVGIPIYGAATLVGWARLQSNKHWLSDVFMGAGLGTLIGIKTVRFNHIHPHNRLDRFFLTATPAIIRDGGGSHAFALMWTAHPGFLAGR